MDLRLSWDLFIIVFFCVVIAYSFIVGKNQTLKIIISTYVAILVADGVSNILIKYINPQFLGIFFPGYEVPSIVIIIKMMLFILAIVTLVIKGGFTIVVKDTDRGIVFLLTNALFGFLSAGLIVSTILYFTAGGNFTHPASISTSNIIMGVQQSSLFVRNMVVYYDIWFSLPAIAFLAASFLDGRRPSYEE